MTGEELESAVGREDECNACGNTEGLVMSESRGELVCTECISFLGEHGRWPDRDRRLGCVTARYEVA